MKLKSHENIIDRFVVEINSDLNDQILSETGGDILEEDDGDKRRKSYIPG